MTRFEQVRVKRKTEQVGVPERFFREGHVKSEERKQEMKHKEAFSRIIWKSKQLVLFLQLFDSSLPDAVIIGQLSRRRAIIIFPNMTLFFCRQWNKSCATANLYINHSV